MNARYLALIDRTLDAYPRAAIERYFADVRRIGLREHGFPRLTANLGVLIAHGRRRDLVPLFAEMMNFCCAALPQAHAGNEFSVRELVCAIEALAAAGAASPAQLARWTADLRGIDPFACYTKIARTLDDHPHNWAVFAAVSEYARGRLCAVDTRDFVELQLATQLHRLDENGMYRDPHAPMVYDLVPRGLFALLLSFGYCGDAAAALDDALRRAGLLTLEMQSTTGEIPYGGRSAQFLHNEAALALSLEYEARRYAAAGDSAMAGRFKHAVTLALDNIDLWLARTPMRHVKNDFAAETAYGCEDYAYFDKYMVTTASFLYAASLICDDGIAAQAAAPRVSAAATSATFHKLFLRAEPYFCQLELSADPHYDAAGLGRVHCAGVPSPLCLSLPAPADPRYTVDGDAPIPFAICPSVLCTGAWHDGCSAVYTVAHLGRDPRAATAVLDTCIEDTPARMTVTVTPSGVTVTAEAEGTVGLLLPAFAFDGTTETAIDCATDTLTVTYVGHRCTILTDGDLTDTGCLARNRNGHYRICRAVGQGRVSATITLV